MNLLNILNPGKISPQGSRQAGLLISRPFAANAHAQSQEMQALRSEVVQGVLQRCDGDFDQSAIWMVQLQNHVQGSRGRQGTDQQDGDDRGIRR